MLPILAAPRSLAAGRGQGFLAVCLSPLLPDLPPFVADGVFGRCEEFPAVDMHHYEVSPGVLQHLTATLRALSRTGTQAGAQSASWCWASGRHGAKRSADMLPLLKNPRPLRWRGVRKGPSQPACDGRGAGGLGPSWVRGGPGSRGRRCRPVRVEGWPCVSLQNGRAAGAPS